MTYRRPSHLGTRAGAALRWAASLALFLVASAHSAHGAGVVGTGTPESCTEAALDAALAGGGMVTFDCGPDPVTITITGTKRIAADAAIDGGSMITISGGNRVGVFDVYSGVTFTVQNLTIANGNSVAGGGISSLGSSTLTVTNSTFSGNSASGPNYTIRSGGAIISGGTLTVTNTTFFDNNAPVGGGGAINCGGTSTITNTTFFDNNAPVGSGILNVGSLTVTNCTFSGNGGVEGAIYNYAVAGRLTVSNTILANSTSGGNCFGPITDGGHNIDDGTMCGFTGTSLSNTNPMLDPAGLANNGGPTQTIALLPDSPAINAGDLDVCANPPVNGVDQRGYARPGTDYPNCSIGAYEDNSSGPPLVSVTPTPTATPSPNATATTTGGPSCTGDCDGNGLVTINELILGVNIALGMQPEIPCTAFANADGVVDIAQLIKGVANALNRCGLG